MVGGGGRGRERGRQREEGRLGELVSPRKKMEEVVSMHDAVNQEEQGRQLMMCFTFRLSNVLICTFLFWLIYADLPFYIPYLCLCKRVSVTEWLTLQETFTPNEVVCLSSIISLAVVCWGSL